MDVQCPAGFNKPANFSHTSNGADELAAKACGGGLSGDLWIDNHNIRFRKGAFLPGINKTAKVAGGHSRRHASSSRGDLIRARRRRQSGWHRLVGIYQPCNQQDAASDQHERYQSFRHGTLLVHYIKQSSERWRFQTSAVTSPLQEWAREGRAFGSKTDIAWTARIQVIATIVSDARSADHSPWLRSSA